MDMVGRGIVLDATLPDRQNTGEAYVLLDPCGITNAAQIFVCMALVAPDLVVA